MAISPIGAGLPALPTVPTSSVAGRPGPDAAGSAGFADQINGAINNLNQLHATADSLAEQAAVGTLEDVHDYTIAATEAAVATELTVAVRNKAVEAFQEIMRMGV
jgi:flagellar hook-basal body complex protein FliE